MKKKFKEFYPLTVDEYKLIWNQALIVFDTNLLLNFYRYSETTFQSFINVLNELDGKIWIPFQVAQEFHLNRLNVIENQIKIYSTYNDKLQELQNDLENKTKNPFISTHLLEETTNTFNNIRAELYHKQKYYENLINNDSILMTVTEIFNNKIGDPFSESELKSIYSEADNRYKYHIPPGYKDVHKKDNEKYGDYILWKEILKKAENDKCHILFITDDIKEDWWIRSQGKTIGPNINLRREFYEVTGQLFYMYRAFNFLEYAQKRIDNNIDSSVMEEVEKFTSNEQLICIEIRNSKEQDIDNLTKMVSNDGYEVFKTDIQDDKSVLQVILPNINDISRRFEMKLRSYCAITNLEIIKIVMV